MKRIYVGALLCAILSLGLLTGCDQGVARSLGGFEVFMTMLLKHLADETDRTIKVNCNSD